MGRNYITPMQEPTFVSTSVLSQSKFRQSSLMGKRGGGDRQGRRSGKTEHLQFCETPVAHNLSKRPSNVICIQMPEKYQ